MDGNFQSNRLTAIKNHLDKRFLDFWQRGIFMEFPYWYKGGPGDFFTGFPQFQLRRLLREQAKEWRRPFITVDTTASPNHQQRGEFWFHGEIKIPKTDAMEQVAGPLFLMKDGCATQNRKIKSYWIFGLTDPDIWDNYLRWLHTDVDVRRAMGIPDEVAPLPYEVTAHDIIRECSLKWPAVNNTTPTLSRPQQMRRLTASSQL